MTEPNDFEDKNLKEDKDQTNQAETAGESITPEKEENPVADQSVALDEEEETSQVQELKNQLLRLQADFVNYKNRVERDKSQSIRFANECLIMKLLPVLDDFERAVQGADANDPVIKGVQLVYQEIVKIFHEEGIEEIPTEGADFDPSFHHAIMMEKRDGYSSNKITETLLKGYFMNGKVIRPSMVKVSE